MEKNIKPAATAKEAPIASQPAAQATINPAIDKANYIIQITDGETVIQQLLAANRGITRVKDLMNNGINVCIAQDSIMDPWYPIGTGNPMREIEMCIHMCHLMGYEELLQSLDLVTENGAKTLNLADRYGVEEGKPANFIVVDADNAYELIRDMAPVLYSVRQGKILMKRPHTEPELFL